MKHMTLADAEYASKCKHARADAESFARSYAVQSKLHL